MILHSPIMYKFFGLASTHSPRHKYSPLFLFLSYLFFLFTQSTLTSLKSVLSNVCLVMVTWSFSYVTVPSSRWETSRNSMRRWNSFWSKSVRKLLRNTVRRVMLRTPKRNNTGNIITYIAILCKMTMYPRGEAKTRVEAMVSSTSDCDFVTHYALKPRPWYEWAKHCQSS